MRSLNKCVALPKGVRCGALPKGMRCVILSVGEKFWNAVYGGEMI